MLDLRESPLRFALLTNDVGMGKTLTAILVFPMQAYMAFERQEAGEPVNTAANIIFNTRASRRPDIPCADTGETAPEDYQGSGSVCQ